MPANQINEIFQATLHRPWPLPPGKWTYYQEWNNALFLHWKVSKEELALQLPGNLSVDTINNEAWISLVAFTMEQIRPKNFPAIPFLSDFHEINIRTYVVKDNKPGVYFLSIEAQKLIPTIIARFLSGLPYEKASMKRDYSNGHHRYSSFNDRKGFVFQTTYRIGQVSKNKSELDLWLTERYCLYLESENELYRYETHHKPWELCEIEVSDIRMDYQVGNVSLNKVPNLIHYSTGVKVVAWQRELLNGATKK